MFSAKLVVVTDKPVEPELEPEAEAEEAEAETTEDEAEAAEEEEAVAAVRGRGDGKKERLPGLSWSRHRLSQWIIHPQVLASSYWRIDRHTASFCCKSREYPIMAR